MDLHYLELVWDWGDRPVTVSRALELGEYLRNR